MIDTEKNTKYPWDCEPGYSLTPEGVEEYITATTQLRIWTKKEGEPEIWAPSLYQSAMKPEHIEIRTMKVRIKKNQWWIQTRYKETKINADQVRIETAPWIPMIEKTDCLHCRNCGHCGW